MLSALIFNGVCACVWPQLTLNGGSEGWSRCLCAGEINREASPSVWPGFSQTVVCFTALLRHFALMGQPGGPEKLTAASADRKQALEFFCLFVFLLNLYTSKFFFYKCVFCLSLLMNLFFLRNLWRFLHNNVIFPANLSLLLSCYKPFSCEQCGTGETMKHYRVEQLICSLIAGQPGVLLKDECEI